ncbi:MAG: YCF48-related protein [Bacteroidetes bacterium]|nr:YCF48-related protein [Bacteroidota bacterium]
MRKPLTLILLLLISSSLLFFTGCSKTTPVADQTYTGWAVGPVYNGFGTIINTQNDGMSWLRQLTPGIASDVSITDISVLNSVEAWAVGDVLYGFGLILHTTDGGISWSRSGNEIQIPNSGLLCIKAINQQKIWVAGKNSTLLYSSDEGSTWTRYVIDTAIHVNYTSIAVVEDQNIWVSGEPLTRIDSTSSVVIFHSADAGQTWQRQGLQSGLSGIVHNIFAVDDSTLFAAAEGYIYGTIDAGVTWHIIFVLNGKKINAVSAQDVNNVWAVGDYDAIYHSKNGGASWDTITPMIHGHHFLGVTTKPTQKIWIVGSSTTGIGKGTILYSNNDGKTWFIEDYPVDIGLTKIAFSDIK